MQSQNFDRRPGRREFLQSAGALALGAMIYRRAGAADAHDMGGKPFWGVFPIGQTPFTPDNKIDLDCLAAEVNFCNRGRVAGMAWPQIASGWSTMSEQERMDGAEAILAAGKGGKTSLVIGVQSIGSDLPTSIRYAQHAEKHGADAIISLPPEKSNDQGMLDYYKAIGAATALPLMVQSQGDMSVDLIVEMFNQIPTMKCVKDEAGNPLARVTQILAATNGKLAVFSGNGVRTMMDEMRLGFSGHCPTTGLADLYQATFDLYHAGDHKAAFDMFGRIQAFNTIPGSGAYIMVARGVFKENTISRPMPGMGPVGGPGPGARDTGPLDDAQKQNIRAAMDEYLKPYLRA
jgi:dihydrodipicolinate synthase/N-acetylneuraminate lyase